MIKDILVSLPVGNSSNSVAGYAVSVAKAFDAHLVGLAFVYEPFVPGTVFDGLSASIINTFRAESQKAADTAATAFESLTSREGISAESRKIESGPASAEELFAQFARRFDLSIVAQAEPGKDAPELLLPESALFGSGRPVLVVPYIQKAPLNLSRVLVGWDGSRAAARAIGDAMPFLTRAKSIDVVTMRRSEEPKDELPGADIAHHLARHKLKVDFKRIVSTDSDVASTILSTAADLGSDMIVMGGYGHSRLREFVLGGATRDMLQAMTVPVLMSH